MTPWSPDATPLPRFVGRYRVTARIGTGAMGSVYAALDEVSDRRVAVKVLLADLEEEPEIRERFLREAKITGQLAHRNVVTIYDLGEEDGRLYLVMELIDGAPLAEYLLTQAGQSLSAKVDLMMQVCQGLQTAHNHDVVHRDIKPSNLLVQRDGTLKILDFGVARVAASDLTAAGLLIGTPEYMSPEQTRGQPVDARSDIFSAAAVFHFMLSGRSPFGARDLRVMLAAILKEPPPALTDAQAPEPLRRVLLKALAKAPEDRYQSCAEMFADLDRAIRTTESTARRIVLAALDRYRQTLALVDERLALARALGLSESEQTVDSIHKWLASEFPWLAARAGDETLLAEPIEKTAATRVLEAVQDRYNAELASLVALRGRAAATKDPGKSASWRHRAAALWRNLHTSKDEE